MHNKKSDANKETQSSNQNRKKQMRISTVKEHGTKHYETVNGSHRKCIR
jgi:hypothetical protein